MVLGTLSVVRGKKVSGFFRKSCPRSESPTLLHSAGGLIREPHDDRSRQHHTQSAPAGVEASRTMTDHDNTIPNSRQQAAEANRTMTDHDTTTPVRVGKPRRGASSPRSHPRRWSQVGGVCHAPKPSCGGFAPWFWALSRQFAGKTLQIFSGKCVPDRRLRRFYLVRGLICEQHDDRSRQHHTQSAPAGVEASRTMTEHDNTTPSPHTRAPRRVAR